MKRLQEKRRGYKIKEEVTREAARLYGEMRDNESGCLYLSVDEVPVNQGRVFAHDLPIIIPLIVLGGVVRQRGFEPPSIDVIDQPISKHSKTFMGP